MKKLFLLFVPILLGLTACDSKLTAEQAEEAVLQGERDRIPLVLQMIPFVDDLTVDSMKLIVREEPMSGFLYTTWKMKKESAQIIVPVDSIRLTQQNGYVEWISHWDVAAKSYLFKNL